jgi:glycosyltransferase involved in cell wall biosynthesis
VKIGIVTLSLNQGKFLRGAIESVRVSKPHELQYVIVDPGSSDGSCEIINQYRERFSAIILDRDNGPADGLNKGFRLCDADIYGYLNADDRFSHGTLDFVLDFFEKFPKVDVLCGAIRIIDEQGRPRFRKRTADKFDFKEFSAGLCMIGQQATFFRKRAYLKTGGFNVNNKTCWDGELIVDLALAKCEISIVYKVLGDFRIYKDSITGSNRLAAQYKQDLLNIRKKISAAGIALYSPWEEFQERLFYKMNLSRHLSYLFVK